MSNRRRRSVIELSHTLGIDPAFSGRLLNMLLMESIRLQQIQHKKIETTLDTYPPQRFYESQRTGDLWEESYIWRLENRIIRLPRR